MLNEKDVTIISVCDELSKHKETSHLVEKVADDLFKPAENVTTEKLYAEYNNILSYIEYKKEWLDSHCSEDLSSLLSLSNRFWNRAKV